MKPVGRYFSRERQWQGALGIQAATAQAAWQGVRLMLAYQALAVTNSVVFVGVVAATFSFAGLIVSVPSGRLVDRYGSARVTGAAMTISLAGVVVAVLAPSAPGMLIAASLSGLGQIYVIVAQQGLVARLAQGSADAAFGTLTAAISIGQLIGPPLVTAAAISGESAGGAHPNTRLGLTCCALLLAVALPTSLALHSAEARLAPAPGRAARPPSLRTILRVPGLLRALVVGATVIVAVDLLTSFVPVWAVAKGIPVDTVGWLLALRALFTIGSRFGVASLVSRFGRKALLLATLGLTVVALAILPFADAWIAIPVMAAIGVGLGLPQPLTLVWVASLAPPNARGAVFGARMTVNRLAQVTLPLLVAALAGPAGVLAVFWSTASILAGGVVLIGLTRAVAFEPRHPEAPGKAEWPKPG